MIAILMNRCLSSLFAVDLKSFDHTLGVEESQRKESDVGVVEFKRLAQGREAEDWCGRRNGAILQVQ